MTDAHGGTSSREVEGAGTGIVTDDTALIITNAHVVDVVGDDA